MLSSTTILTIKLYFPHVLIQSSLNDTLDYNVRLETLEIHVLCLLQVSLVTVKGKGVLS